ncbi:unnamed protein product, partial [Rotaria sordida]
MELFKFFAPRLYSLHIGYNNTDIDLSQCCQLRTLEMSSMKEEDLTAIQSSTMPYLQRLVIQYIYFLDGESFFDRLFTEPFSMLTMLQLRGLEFDPKPNYKPLMSVKSLSGICCKWEDFNSILSLFPQLHRLSLSLYTYRENPRWASIKPLKLPLNNFFVKFSSKMVTPDDDPAFHLLINTRLRHVKLDASISKQNDSLLLIDILPQTVQRIENVIEQKITEELYADNNQNNLEAL